MVFLLTVASGGRQYMTESGTPSSLPGSPCALRGSVRDRQLTRLCSFSVQVLALLGHPSTVLLGLSDSRAPSELPTRQKAPV